MGKNYKQLRLEDRDRITEMMAEDRSITEIAEALGRHKSILEKVAYALGKRLEVKIA